MQPIVATSAAAVTPDDGTVLPIFNALHVGGTGNVAVLTKNGETVTFTGVPSGSILPVAGTKVMATNTTATAIVALRW